MKPFVACLFVALVSGASCSVEKWANFKSRFGKMHHEHDDDCRHHRFMARSAEIDAHNERFNAGLESYSMKINQYADLSAEEFRASALGFIPVVNASEIPHIELPPMAPMASRFDWRDYGRITPVRDQGYCGSCYAFAAGGVLEAFLAKSHGQYYDLSEQDVVDCSFRRFMGQQMNGGCQGGHPTAVFDYYNQKDIVMENQYPYFSGRSQNHGQCRAPSPVNNAVRSRLVHRHVMPRSEDELAQILVSKGPIVLGMAADNEHKASIQDLGNGIFDKDSSINLQPNHVVVLVGYGEENGKRFWSIKNSWGTVWGAGGFGRIIRGKNMANIMASGVWYLENNA